MNKAHSQEQGATLFMPGYWPAVSARYCTGIPTSTLLLSGTSMPAEHADPGKPDEASNMPSLRGTI